MKGGEYIIMGVPGTALDAATAAIIREVQPAGFILFGRNIKTAEELRKLLDDLRAEVRHEPIVTIDQEGGRVSRLKECGAEPPSAKQLRDKGDLRLIERHGALTGEILRLFGFNLDLAPVVDISHADDLENSLKNRTWGLDPASVIRNAGAFNRTLREQGVLSCGKHFPGYSYAAVDPHHELPIVARSRAELEAWEWKAFRALLPELDTMMVGHANYPALDDSGLPSSLSPRIVQGLLREAWGYQGAIISDDLDMGAIVGHYGLAESVTRAVEAGNDLVLLCHRPELIPDAARALDAIPAARAAQAAQRIAKVRKKLDPPQAFSLEAHAEIDRRIYQLRVDTLGAEAAAERSVEDGKRSPVETF
ncbi:MAG: glycoside hydrolase family 3 N-terminal domain-containing protein [Verrucomicrobiota bacterium]